MSGTETETELNLSVDQFISTLFRNEPMPPYSFRLEFEEGQVISALASILATGASLRYNKKIDELSEREISTMRQYLQSIGWDADYALVVLNKEVLDYYPSGKPFIRLLKLNKWQIIFKTAEMPQSVYGCAHVQS